MFPCNNISINEKGHIAFANMDTVDLAKKYGTPLYLIDENKVREKIRIYKDAIKKYLGENGSVLYASKACSFKNMYRIMSGENIGIDVVSSGEIYTAKAAGFDVSYAYFHGNNKTDEDIEYAIDSGVGYFVVDNLYELESLNKIASDKNIIQKILLRITPGIDTHTYAAVNTGKVDSKFGSAIETGQAEEITKVALGKENVKLVGFHCHVGSQVFGEDVFSRAASIMMNFIFDIYKKYSFMAEILDLGGGYGVNYVFSDPTLDIDTKIKEVAATLTSESKKYGIKLPYILVEPGRSIVADAGMTLYSVGSVKTIPGYKNYISIDGGMTDNPRYALYKSKYTCLNATRANDECNFVASLVGRCCESGDIVQENVAFPKDTTRGDIIAVCTTGAYNYSMSSNYNRIPRPPVINIKNGKDEIVVKKETFENLTSLDI